MNEFKRHQQTSINVQKQANLIWNVADILRGYTNLMNTERLSYQ